MSKKNEGLDAEQDLQAAETAAARPKPKRKFDILIGGMRFEKRCTVQEARGVLQASADASVILNLDGETFSLIL